MPRYFFHVSNGENAPDHEGVELASAREACEEAVRAAGGIWSERSNVFWDGSSTWTMHVVDSLGETVCRLSFSASLGQKA